MNDQILVVKVLCCWGYGSAGTQSFQGSSYLPIPLEYLWIVSSFLFRRKSCILLTCRSLFLFFNLSILSATRYTKKIKKQKEFQLFKEMQEFPIAKNQNKSKEKIYFNSRSRENNLNPNQLQETRFKKCLKNTMNHHVAQLQIQLWTFVDTIFFNIILSFIFFTYTYECACIWYIFRFYFEFT